MIIGENPPRHAAWAVLSEEEGWEGPGDTGVGRYRLSWSDGEVVYSRSVHTLTVLSNPVMLGTHPDLIGPLGVVAV